MSEANIDDVLNAIGFGRMQYFIFFSCAAQQMYVATEQLGLGLVCVASSCDFDIDEHRLAWLMSAVFLAQVATSHYMGFKSDEIGRRKLLLITSLLTMIASAISSFMPEYWSFLVMRFLTSCFLAGPGMTVLTYMSEFTKIKLRPYVANFLSYAIGLGMLYVPLMAMWLLPLDLQLKIADNYYYTSWRVLMLFYLLPGIVSWVMIYMLPESPKYYLSIDQPLMALAVLEKCCRVNLGKDVTLKTLGFGSVSQPHLPTGSFEKRRWLLARMWYDTKPLLQGQYLRHMVLVNCILFILFGAGFGLSVWLPRILQILSESSEPMVLCELVYSITAENSTDEVAKCIVTHESLTFMVFNGCCVMAMFMLISILLIFINRKIILIAFSVLATVSGFILNFVKTIYLLVACFVFLTASPFCSLRLVLSVLIDVIPTHLRTKSVAMALTVGRIGVLFSNLFIGYTLTWNCYLTFNTYFVLMLVAFVLITRLPSEEKVQNIASK